MSGSRWTDSRLTGTTAASPLRSATGDWVRALERTAAICLDSTDTIARTVDRNAAAAPQHEAIVGEATHLTHADLAALTNRYARWARAEGLGPGDVVGLMMENSPTYVAVWIGLSRIGIVTALLNTQLTGAGLAHCIAAAALRHIIADAAAAAALAPVLDTHIRLSVETDLAAAIAALPAGPLAPHEAHAVTLRDPALLIYTSGTTGLPKAARVSHYRIIMWSEWIAGIMNATPDDRLYDCLPLYHSVGGILAVGAMLAAGGTIIVRRSFSASRFWVDVRASRATIFQYIGELCRYLVAAPPDAADTTHGLRLCVGNGLRADVWPAFERRFAIPRVIEFYAATEGSFSLFNLEGKQGAIGRVPRFMAHRSPVAIVRYDHESGGPLRGADGFCLRCGPDEAGEAIGRVTQDAKDLATRFEGYTSESESETKILRDVFATGDRWFRTGDLMRQDKAGFFSFVDRIGDTFRWKGENVATSEVAEVLRAGPGILAAEVYGVAVPGQDGRAGMAALVVADAVDLAALHAHVAAALPRYARPVFLRLTKDFEMTGTFKPKKATLIADGFDPSRVDRLLIDDQERYRPMTGTDHQTIRAGNFRL